MIVIMSLADGKASINTLILVYFMFLSTFVSRVTLLDLNDVLSVCNNQNPSVLLIVMLKYFGG